MRHLLTIESVTQEGAGTLRDVLNPVLLRVRNKTCVSVRLLLAVINREER